MKSLAALALLLVACDVPVKPADTCASDALLNELSDAKRTWGETWCPPAMDIDIREIDDAGNALCAYASSCGVVYQITGCSPSYGVRCVAWLQAATGVDRLTIVSAKEGE